MDLSVTPVISIPSGAVLACDRRLLDELLPLIYFNFPFQILILFCLFLINQLIFKKKIINVVLALMLLAIIAVRLWLVVSGAGWNFFLFPINQGKMFYLPLNHGCDIWSS